MKIRILKNLRNGYYEILETNTDIVAIELELTEFEKEQISSMGEHTKFCKWDSKFFSDEEIDRFQKRTLGSIPGIKKLKTVHSGMVVYKDLAGNITIK